MTADVIRRWEEGQPPATTDELDALLKVMRAHGLSQPEVEQFRTAVYAACLDHHYPEAFACEDFAQRPDVDEAALSLYWTLCIQPWEAGVVQGVACLDGLRAQLRRHPCPGAPHSQQRRQEAALAFLQGALAGVHASFGRSRMAVDAVVAAGTIVEQRFDGRLTYWITGETLRGERLYRSGYVAWEQFRTASHVVPALLELYEQGAAQSDTELRLRAISWAVDYLGQSYDPDWPVAVRSLEDAHFASIAAHGDGVVAPLAHLCHASAALARRAWADVERHLKGFEHWETDENDWCRLRWEGFMGNFARKRADWAEAIDHFEELIPLANQIGDHGFADWTRGRIRDCHDQQEMANRRKTKPRKPVPSPAAK